jgi:histidine kinase
MISFFRRRLFWKFFFSYFTLVVLSMLVMGVVVRVLLPGLFNNHLVTMATLLSQYGVSEGGHMMGGRGMMMQGSVLFTDLFGIFNQIILDAVLYAFLPSMIVALLVSVGMSRQFVYPLQQMIEAADRIAEGNYQERLPVGKAPPEVHDELERLAVRFNRMTNRLEQIEEMRQKLIGDVAHELRTPLTVIKGSIEGLMDGVLEPDKTTLERIYRQADRLDRLVNDLQELNRIEDGILALNPKSVNLNKFLADIIHTMQINFTKEMVELQLDLPEEAINIRVDEDRLQQIMMNLLSNALRYTPAGGQVRVAVRKDAQSAEVSVADTGIGIPEEHLPHVFERLYRVEDSRSRRDGGSGIGLTIVKKLIEAQSGLIWAESAGEGEGAVFRFTLPLAL